MNIFGNFVSNKIKKVNLRGPDWMNRSIKLFLKKRLKLTKKYQNNS